MSSNKIDPEVIDLYDQYCHGYMDRREFFNSAAKVVVGGVPKLAMAADLPQIMSKRPHRLTSYASGYLRMPR